MSDLVGNPEDRFSHVAAHLIMTMPVSMMNLQERRCYRKKDTSFLLRLLNIVFGILHADLGVAS